MSFIVRLGNPVTRALSNAGPFASGSSLQTSTVGAALTDGTFLLRNGGAGVGQLYRPDQCGSRKPISDTCSPSIFFTTSSISPSLSLSPTTGRGSTSVRNCATVLPAALSGRSVP